MLDLQSRIKANAQDIESALDAYLSPERLSGPGPAPGRLVEAMRHGALGGGKRLRPFILRETANAFEVATASTLRPALAVELVHCYSLIHDDLPAMDDDDMRRGRPTVHKAFDEATAILAGDGLLTHAFALLAETGATPDPAVGLALVAELAAGAGVGGMAGGQMRDLEGENGGFSRDDVAAMQAMKTGALIRAAVRMGAILGKADAAQLDALTAYAEAAGRAFQIADDLLDVTASAATLGKATGKDEKRGKATHVRDLGVTGARTHLAETVEQAVTALAGFGNEADGLRETARHFGERPA